MKIEDVTWIELCAYVETEIFNYNTNQKLQKKACLVLQGITKGQNIANNKQQTYGNYSYGIILLTFKANKTKILNAIKNKDFESEEQKMKYVAAIIRDSINDIYNRYEESRKSEEKIKRIDTNILISDIPTYSKKQSETSEKLQDKFKEFW